MKIEKILYFVIIIACWLIIWTWVDYFKLKLSPHTIFFEYTSLTPSKEEYQLWEEIFFTSTVYREKPIYMEYHDILRCDSGSWSTWYSSTSTKSKMISKVWTGTSLWRYEWELPWEQAICFLDSYPSVLLNYWIKKTQNIQTIPFKITE